MHPRPDVHFLMPANRGALQSAPEKPITNPPCSKLVFPIAQRDVKGQAWMTSISSWNPLTKNVRKN